MKLRDWYKFNFENDDFSAYIGEFNVTVLRNPSPKTDERIFTHLMRADDMLSIFGDYTLYSIGETINIYKDDESTHAEGNKTEEITLNMMYYYKGSRNSTVTLKRNKNGYISIITEDGKDVDSYEYGAAVLDVLFALINNEYK